MGLGTGLTILFVVLKLVGGIAWSWLWVFSPILIEAAIGLLILTGAVTFVFGGSKKKTNRITLGRK